VLDGLLQLLRAARALSCGAICRWDAWCGAAVSRRMSEAEVAVGGAAARVGGSVISGMVMLRRRTTEQREEVPEETDSSLEL